MTTDHAAMALALAKANGCTCSPAVATRPDATHPHVRHVELRHDGWCALLVSLERRN